PCLRSFERFLDDEPERTPPLIKAARRARAVRNDPSLSRRQRPPRAAADRAATGGRRRAPRATAHPEPLVQEASRALLRAAERGAAARRLGALARVLRRGRGGERHAGGGHGECAARRSTRAGHVEKCILVAE